MSTHLSSLRKNEAKSRPGPTIRLGFDRNRLAAVRLDDVVGELPMSSASRRRRGMERFVAMEHLGAGGRGGVLPRAELGGECGGGTDVQRRLPAGAGVVRETEA